MAGAVTGGGGDDVHEENGVLFWINRSGFPMDECTWDQMWDHVSRNHPEGVRMTEKIRNSTSLPQVPAPQPPLNFPATVAIPERLERIQQYMTELEYNHTGTQFYEIRKNRPVTGLMECAKEMIREALPIKCLEAVILGIFLTNGMMGVERFPLSFKSIYNGHIYRHVVLGIYQGGRYGAIGMSRRDDLMYKPLEYESLTDVVLDFQKCYMRYWHDLRKVKVGLPVPHDQHSYEMISWKAKSWIVNASGTKNIITHVDPVSLRDSPTKNRDPSPVRIAKVKSRSDPNPSRRNSNNTKGDYNVRI
ncbi:tubulinyl-Tyr carboxypeptidase 1-like isoform X2 [Littorina saxatilis]|uniref:tubulinyl-Tyr carboxypeptidase 1-like isoform X2 n=1 Tax=Littorina saxatilis TaxID=31220 RepID=UPI0038B48D85